MDFSIVTDTAGASVSELGSALRELLVDKINKKYEKYNISIGIAIRCLPDSYGRRSFVRYTKSDNYLTIDFCVSVITLGKEHSWFSDTIDWSLVE